jgi:hypothetical protein
MSVDRYTKVVLTVIAVCLVWIALGGRALTPPVGAQARFDRVILAGWEDENGNARAFPNPPPPANRFKPSDGKAPSHAFPIWNTNP